MRASRRTDSPDPAQDTVSASQLPPRVAQDCQSYSWRWLLVVFLVGLLNASLFALVTPPWQAPDEPGHFEYACLLGQLRRPLSGDDRSLALQQAILASLDRNDFWPLVREPQPAPLPLSFAADPFLLRSARQVGDEPLPYYLAPAGICLLPLSIETQARLMRLYGALLFGLTAAATAWGWTGGSRPPAAGRWHPLLLALLPMPAFIAASVNNDSLALFSATLVFAAVLRIQRLGWTWPRGLGLAAALALALGSKKTNAFLLAWLAALTLVGLWRWLGRRGWSSRRRAAALAAAAGVVALVLALPTPTPASWRGVGQIPGGGRVQTDLPAGAGWAVRVVDRSPRRTGRLYQNLDGPAVIGRRGQQISATILVRSIDGEPAPGRVAVRDAAGVSQEAFVAGDQWQPVSVQHTLAITTTYVRLVVFPTAGQAPDEMGRILVAGATLLPEDGSPRATLLRNGDFIRPARLGELLAAPLDGWWRQYAPRRPAEWVAPQRSLLYGALTFAGFWGNYGWLQAPLPPPLYGLLALVTAAAGAGVLLRWRREATQRPVLAAWLLACAFIALQVFLPMVGRAWQPQGRYLFPALLPLTGLLVMGLDHWLRLDSAPRRLVGVTLVAVAFNLAGLATAARIF